MAKDEAYLEAEQKNAATLKTSATELDLRSMKLTSLILSNNQLTTLSDSLGQLMQLLSLNIRQNKLTTLPKDVGNLINLRELLISENKLEEFP
jgi:Leucine-rich repeat (LRR) protein